MSGSAGGNRIKREYINDTVNQYTNDILNNCENYKEHIITGSFISKEKSEFGDIDLVVYFDSDSLQNAKKDLIKLLITISDDIIVPFKSVKYSGRKYLNTGEIITVLYPIKGSSEYVQIDNIICLSKKELNFKHTFLSYPASMQGLILGLVKTVLLEHDTKTIFSYIGIFEYPILNGRQEFEFNLSSSKLTLRIVTLDKFKTIDKINFYEFKYWDYVEKILYDYKLDNFQSLYVQVKNNLKHSRSKQRVKGVFKSMVSVKSGEINTPKAEEKLNSLKMIENM